MPRTQTKCPRCGQPVLADIDQLFDVYLDPQAKNRLLSGSFNIISCAQCGFQGMASTPIVYHDPEKELLLTFFPAELNVPINEQERMVGPLINQVVNNLPQEMRKGYLFQPKTMLTLQGLLETVLEADGITKEMIEQQQNQLKLIQRLASSDAETRKQVLKEEENLIDEAFFTLITRLAEASMAQGDQQSASVFAELQKLVLEETEIGKQIKEQAEEAQAAVKSLQELSQSDEGLTREALLDLIINAPNETHLSTLINMAYTGMDYQFFQLLSQKIDNSSGEENEKLTALRERLLQFTQEIQEKIQEQKKLSLDFLEALIKEPNVEEATARNLNQINEFFLEALQEELKEARKNGDLERSAKLQQVNSVIEKASAPPPEIALIEQMLPLKDDADIEKFLTEHKDEITPEFSQILSSIVMQSEQQNPEIMEKLKQINRVALRFTMKANMQSSS